MIVIRGRKHTFHKLDSFIYVAYVKENKSISTITLIFKLDEEKLLGQKQLGVFLLQMIASFAFLQPIKRYDQ